MTAPDQEESRLDFSLGADHISFDIDETVYPLEAIYGASYRFVDRCFVYLSRLKPGTVSVRLTARGSVPPADLEALAREFGNELLAQVTRLQLSQGTVRIREYYTAAALRATAAAPSVDELLAELESEELLDDPLEIMVPWEEKHGGKKNETESK